jgi:hypothetical protein
MKIPSGNLSAGKILPNFSGSAVEIIRQRYSCRVYQENPVEPEQAVPLQEFAGSLTTGPLGSPIRFMITLSGGKESIELKQLGTYGFIRKPAGFILGASGDKKFNLEDFGYGMEAIVLYATSLGLGTCWLGGTFTRSSFSEKTGLAVGETLPAVVSMGYPADKSRNHHIRTLAGSGRRLPWSALFFDAQSGLPLEKEKSGPYVSPLEMVRMAPSASNYQPWRIVKEASHFHFFLQRNKSLKPGSPLNRLMKMADLQRVDIGIAMCHFELAASESGLSGKWEEQKPAGKKIDPAFEYIISWKGI